MKIQPFRAAIHALSLAAIVSAMPQPMAAATTPSAEDILAAAKAKAASGQKAVFVHFSASWCGWCKRLEAFIAADDVKPVFDKYFVDAKLIVSESPANKALENPGGDDLLKKLGGPAGLPFHAFLDAKGELIVNSNRNGKEGNIGHPVQPQEIDWFLHMVKKAAPKITEAELQKMESHLRNQPK